MSLIKQLRPGSEVKSLTLPMFVCQPCSTLEAFGDRFLHPSMFLPLGDIDDPKDRFLAVVKFFLGAWHLKPKGVKKPLNPIIGEVFNCVIAPDDSGDVGVHGENCLDDSNHDHDEETADDGFTHYVSEQIAHHPPITGLVSYNVSAGVVCHAVLRPGYAKFWGNTAESKLNGTAYLRVFGKEGWEETYALTFPSFNVRGILMGQLCIEVVGKTQIRCVSGENCGSLDYVADIEFKSKGMFRGKFNQLTADISDGGKTLHTLSGAWDGDIMISDKGSKKSRLFHRISDASVGRKRYPAVDNQEEMFSHRVWDPVLSCVEEGRDADAMNAKLEMEAKQRGEEKARLEANEDWVPRWWNKTDKPVETDSDVDEASAELNEWAFCSLDELDRRIRKSGRGVEKS
jgi:oxysterol-binding protein-related protein 8